MSAPPVLMRAWRLLPPETAHALAIRALRHGLGPRVTPPASLRLATTLCGFALAHPLGLAAGFDKNAEAVPGLFRLGFSFVEIGTVTPRPQAGNPRPRLFRLPAQQALINRMGFNNDGLEAVRARLARSGTRPGPLGANIGANRDAKDPVADYVACLRGLYELVDYVTVNVSSPNTPGLRDLQGRARLDELLGALLETRAALAGQEAPKPLLLKVAPDLDPEQEAAIAEVALGRGLDGLIISNTTIARPPGLSGRYRDEAGGLSGAPLFATSTAQLARFHRLCAGRLPLVGVGGILTGADAYAKIRAGASALQLYTGLIYRGPRAVGRILAELDRLLAEDGIVRLADARGKAA
ncbi:MAG TPA: quinone-dependent dihydroorotate dehydrogenase [Geminicoccaceae bacterium]|nr:quinone-dependent dihydroorotate dehydrogenase [Geminicoccaceae bacterium]